MRARPGRRTVEERPKAVLEPMAGKATVDQIARRVGVHAETAEARFLRADLRTGEPACRRADRQRRSPEWVTASEGWRQGALAGVEQALRRGSGKTASELELELELEHRDLEKVVTTLSIQKCLLEQALEIVRAGRPTGPARSRR